MNRSRITFVASCILGACATLASAQAPGGFPTGGRGGPGGQGGQQPRHPMSPLIKALDANGDGIIDAGEIANAPAALKRLDANGDGKLTRDEYLPPRPGGQGPMGGPGGENATGMGFRGPGNEHQRPVSPLVKAIDVNGDGIIDADEISNADAALRKLDKNGDGKLARDEYLPPRPGGQDTNERFKAGEEGEGAMGAPLAGSFGQNSTPAQTEDSHAGTTPGTVPRQITIGEPSSPEPAQAASGDLEVVSVTGVASLSNPLRLMVSGNGFQEGCKVQVNGKPAPNTIFRGEHMAVAEGAGLERLLPQGVTVMITVETADGHFSAPIAFTR